MAALDAPSPLRYQGCGKSTSGARMAIDPAGGHSAMDYPEHIRTYSGFIRATIIMIVFVVLILLYMLFFLVP
jgi:hypothetical protein